MKHSDDPLDEGHPNWHFQVHLDAVEYAQVLACVMAADSTNSSTRRALTEARTESGRYVGGRAAPALRYESLSPPSVNDCCDACNLKRAPVDGACPWEGCANYRGRS